VLSHFVLLMVVAVFLLPATANPARTDLTTAHLDRNRTPDLFNAAPTD
jgi:hypothetical protein